MGIVETPAGARLSGYEAPPKEKIDATEAGTFHGSGEDVALALEAFYARCRERAKAKVKTLTQTKTIKGFFKGKQE